MRRIENRGRSHRKKAVRHLVIGCLAASLSVGDAIAQDAPDGAQMPDPVAPSYADGLLVRARSLLAPESGARDPNFAARLLNEVVQIGNAEAMVTLADLYRRGEGVEQSRTTAESLLVRALASGNFGPAGYALGDLYSEPGPKQSIQKAISSFETSAEHGDTRSMVRLARLLIDGRDVAQDLERAESLLDAAMAAGELRAAGETLGDLHAMRGPAFDPKAASVAYAQAVVAGNSDAMVKLARMYADGAVVKDLARAEALLLRAIDGGSGAAAWEGLGDLYLLPGGDRDIDKGIDAYSRAADLQNANAMLKLAGLIIDGPSSPTDFPRAESLLRAAIDHGRAGEGGLALGDLLRAPGPLHDPIAAAEAYSRAVDAGNATAMVRLSRMLIEGDEIPPNSSQAIMLLKRAVELDGDADAWMTLGDFYLGEGTSAGASAALVAYQAATTGGNSEAAIKFARLLFDGRAGDPQPDRARLLLETTISEGETAEAWATLGDLYRQPNTSFRNLVMAADAYSAASRMGDVISRIKLGELLIDGSLPRDVQQATILFESAVASGAILPAASYLGDIFQTYPPPGGDQAKSRVYFEMASSAGSESASLVVALLASKSYQDAKERRSAIDHFKAASRVLPAREVAIRIMQLEAPAVVMLLQELLNDAGHSVGIDGQHGPATRAAIASFCASKEMKNCETAFVSIELLSALLS